jgi:hypothetical protein
MTLTLLWKKRSSEVCEFGIDVIGGQVIFGGAGLERRGVFKGDGEFYHYTLGKLGSSFGHLDPKKKGRTMCELFGAYG